MANLENEIWVVAQLESGEVLGVTYELLGKALSLIHIWIPKSGNINIDCELNISFQNKKDFFKPFCLNNNLGREYEFII